MKMIEGEGQVIVAVTRKITCSSLLLVDLLKRFDEAQGYDHLIDALGRPETSLHNLKDLVLIVSQCAPLFHKTFIDKVFDRFKDAAESKLLSADEKYLRETRFDAIEEIVEAIWIKTMCRMAPNLQIQIFKYKLLTKLGIKFLQQNFVQKRIDGAQAIHQVCQQAQLGAATPSNDAKKAAPGTNEDILGTLV